MTKLEIKFKKLQKALCALENIYQKPNLEDRSNIDATIQRFEFTFELFWKTLKDFFYEKGLDVSYPKDILKEAYLQNILDDENLWLQMLKSRNLTSHTYDENLADDIFKKIKVYVPALRMAVCKLETLIILK